MRRYLFLLAWVEGSDSSADEPTGIHDQDDLLPEYKKGNEHVFAVEIRLPQISMNEFIDYEIAKRYGYAEAFFNNYTAHDSVSTLEEIDDTFVHPDKIKVITVKV